MSFTKILTASLISAVALSSAVASAATSLLRYDSDTRTNSASTPDAFSNTAAGDTDGSLKFSTGGAGGGNKVAVTFYTSGGTGTPAGGVLGTLGDLNHLSFDYYMDGATMAPGSTLAPAVRLKLSPNGTPSTTYVDLVYEPVYQAGYPGSTPVNAWQNDVETVAGTFWQHSNNANHDGAPDFQPLSAFAAGYTPTFNGAGVTLNASTPIYGVEFSLGSGLPNNFAAYIDDVQIGFASGSSFAANVATPEPTSLASLAAVGLVALRRRRK